MEPSTYVDIGDRVTASVSYGDGRNVDTEQFKARKEVRDSVAVATWDQGLAFYADHNSVFGVVHHLSTLQHDRRFVMS